MKVGVHDVADRLRRDVAEALHGFECVSTTITPASLSMIAVFELTL